jgi:phenylalanine-4-hydroxylase
MQRQGHAGGEGCLVELDRDHPGFRDGEYRARRDAIARIAYEYPGGEVADAPYTDAEHGVWRAVWEHLGPLHERWAPRGYLVLNQRLGLDRARIPQLRDVNRRLRQVTGFEMEPVAGLIDPRTFLSYLDDSIFLATQYVRHHSAPLYTPEPDVIHELVGHAASFTHPMIAHLNRSFGRAARAADDTEITALERVHQ